MKVSNTRGLQRRGSPLGCTKRNLVTPKRKFCKSRSLSITSKPTTTTNKITTTENGVSHLDVLTNIKTPNVRLKRRKRVGAFASFAAAVISNTFGNTHRQTVLRSLVNHQNATFTTSTTQSSNTSRRRRRLVGDNSLHSIQQTLNEEQQQHKELNHNGIKSTSLHTQLPIISSLSTATQNDQSVVGMVDSAHSDFLKLTKQRHSHIKHNKLRYGVEVTGNIADDSGNYLMSGISSSTSVTQTSQSNEPSITQKYTKLAPLSSHRSTIFDRHAAMSDEIYRTGRATFSTSTSSSTTKSSSTTATTKKSKKDDVTSQYQRMSQREHVLLRPEPYLGSNEVVTERTWILTKPLVDGEDETSVVDVDFNFIPGLYKIFDEILVNAADNVHRATQHDDKTSKSALKRGKENDPSTMTYMDIQIDPVANRFAIENDGASIPIVMYEQDNHEPLYLPELLFGHLLTSSNYDDSKERFVGGRHGYGAKLTNIFSKKFVVTIGNHDKNLIYRQVFTDNLEKIHPPTIINTETGRVTNDKGHDVTDTLKATDPDTYKLLQDLKSKKGGKNFTGIEFYPDLKRFGVDKLTFLPSGLTPEQQNETILGQTNHSAKDLEAAKAKLQKQQLKQALSGVSMPVKTTSTTPPGRNGAAVNTDLDVTITLHKNSKLNEMLQKDPTSCFPPFLLPLFERRVLDCGALMGNFGVKVRYNGKTLQTNNYLKYLKKCPSFPDPDGEAKQRKKAGLDDTTEADEDELDEDKLTGTVVTTWLDDKWFIGVSQRPQYHSVQSGSQSLNQLSFVNSVATTRGGNHVNYITDILARHIVNYINQPARKKRYNLEQDVTLGLVKQFMCVFVSCYIHNPSFDTQTKETLITHIKGPQTVNPSKSATHTGPAIPEKFLTQICRDTGIIQNIALSLQQRQHKQLLKKIDAPRKQQRSGGLAIEKLDDALWAGTDKSQECTLILTEGDSAKALAVSGLSVLGRERFGVYPLKGKLLNVRDASKASIAGNKELVEIMQILGLRIGQSDRSTLRYGSILVMADQDHDGSHIKGLLVNAMHTLCPDLVRENIHEEIPNTINTTSRPLTIEGKEVVQQNYTSTLPKQQLKLNNQQHQFIRLFVTPIVKATWLGSDYPIVQLQRNLNYQNELLEFQKKYGHLTPKQIDQLNATRKMIYQNKKDSLEALKNKRLKKRKKQITNDKGEIEEIEELLDEHGNVITDAQIIGPDGKVIDVNNSEEMDQFELIQPPEQYTTTTTFGKQSQHIPPNLSPTSPVARNTAALPAKRVNDSISVKNKVISFYSQFAYKLWWESLPPTLQRKFKCKYYKGLGTSTSAEGKEYFSDLPSHIIDLLHRNKNDDKALDLAFAKDEVDNRKTWVMENSHIAPSDEYIRNYNKKHIIEQIQLAHKTGKPLPPHIQARYLASRYTTINDFIHNELVQFSVADTIRSLPSTLDGLKPSQRKITFAALTKPLQNEVRVSQFAAFVSERLVYHHGEQSLTAAIVNLAQEFPGTNNIPLLHGVGQFGTRHTGGKDHASARYIYTKLGPLTQDLFPAADNDVLPQQEEEGQKIEPIHLLPILPLMIINGSDGIGTGFSTAIPAHNPMHVFQAVVQWLRGEKMRLVAPYQLGMTSQLVPAQGCVQPFDQAFNVHTTSKSDIFKIPTVDEIENEVLKKEIKIPKIDTKNWHVVPLDDTTDINKLFQYDNSYLVNHQVLEEIGDVVKINNKRNNIAHNDDNTQNMAKSLPIINVDPNSPINPGLLQYDINNKPILNQKVLHLQQHLKTNKPNTAAGMADVNNGGSNNLHLPNTPLVSDQLATLRQKVAHATSPTTNMTNNTNTTSVPGLRRNSTDNTQNNNNNNTNPSTTATNKPFTMQDATSYHVDNNYINRTDITINKWISQGKYFPDANSKRTLHIVELPYGVTTSNYKKFLLSLLSSNKDNNSKDSKDSGKDINPEDQPVVIDRIEERHTEQHVWFTIHCQQSTIDNLTHDDIISKLKLTANLSLNNMHGFGGENNLHGFTDVRIPLAEYCVERLKCYERRRAVQITEKWRQLRLASNISRFCQMIMTGELSLQRKSKQELCDELQRMGFDIYTDIYPKSNNNNNSTDGKSKDVINDGDDDSLLNTTKGGKKQKKKDLGATISQSTTIRDSNQLLDELSDLDDNDDDDNNNNTTNQDLNNDMEKIPKNAYDYLLKIPMVSATKEKVAQLNKQMALLQTQVASLVHTTAKQMWLHELSQLQPKLEQYMAKRHDSAIKHPFVAHPSYKAALDGVTVLKFTTPEHIAQKAKAIADAKNNKNNDDDDDDADATTPTKRTRAKKGETTETATKAKKSTTAKKKATTTKKKTTTAKAKKASTTTRAKKAFTSSTSSSLISIDNNDMTVLYGDNTTPVQFKQLKPYLLPTIPYNDGMSTIGMKW